MKYIFELNHPKHYYQFKYVMRSLQQKGHQIMVLARNKDVLLDVLQQDGVPYEIFGKHKKNLFAKIWGTFAILYNYHRIVKRFKPDVIITKASFYGVFSAKIAGIKSIIFPDSEVVVVTNKFVVPLCTKVVTPDTFGLNYGAKHIRIKGFFENCYLAPTVFSPQKSVIDQYGLKQPYAIFRFVGWFANHDVKNSGFTLEEKIKLIESVKPYLTIYISSEKELPDELKQYRLPTPASQIHSVLSFADLYIGDSQTMATEAALLGTPAIRSNSFVGEHDMTNFIVLEQKYQLLKNVSAFEDVLQLSQYFASNSQKDIWKDRQNNYYQSVGDSNQTITDIILSL